MKYVDEVENVDKPGTITNNSLNRMIRHSRNVLEEVKERHKTARLRTVIIDSRTTIQTTSELPDTEIRDRFINATKYYPI